MHQLIDINWSHRWLLPQIAQIFTSDPKVIAATSALAPVVAVVVIGDGLNATFAGVIRGAARQTLGVLVNLAAYWVIITSASCLSPPVLQ